MTTSRKRQQPTRPQPTDAELRECAECLYEVVKDVMPQIGKIVLQDYARLNRGLILAERFLAP